MFNKYSHSLGVQRSAIRELFDYGIRQAAVVGKENILDFSLGNPSIPAPASVNENIIDIVKNTDSLTVHGYTSAPGYEGVRAAVAKELTERTGMNIEGRNLYFTCGAAPALITVFKALNVNPETEILAVAPFFPEYNPFITGAGNVFKYVPANTENFQIRFDEMEKMINKNTQGVIINSPNNPSGVVFSRETLERLAELLERKSKEVGHPIYLISDEPYRELVYGGVEVPWVPSIYRNTIVCYSYSKSLSIPGERLGYICVPDCVEESADVFAACVGSARLIGHTCPPSLMQRVVERCAYERPDIEAYDVNRKILYDGLQEIGYECAKPDGAFYMFFKVPSGTAQEFSDRCKERNLLVVPSDSFGVEGYIRLSYCVAKDTIERSLPIFKEVYDTYK